MFSFVICYVTSSLWSLYKYLAHSITGKTELHRLLDKYDKNNSNTYANRDFLKVVDIERCLLYSKQLKSTLFLVFGGEVLNKRSNKLQFIGPKLSVKSAVELTTQAQLFTQQILDKKRLNLSDSLATSLYSCVHSILSINFLSAEIAAATEPYVSENPEHEKLLLALWSAYKPEMQLRARISKDWEELGFQGENPATDFRAMGLLGLKQLISLAQAHGDIAAELLQRSQLGGLSYYSFAITGINISNDLVQLTRDRKLDNYYYKYGINLNSFNQLYVTLFVRLDELWQEEAPDSVMQYAEIHAKFIKTVLKHVKNLADPSNQQAIEYIQPIPKQASSN
jgi:hypothetical protein